MELGKKLITVKENEVSIECVNRDYDNIDGKVFRIKMNDSLITTDIPIKSKVETKKYIKKELVNGLIQGYTVDENIHVLCIGDKENKIKIDFIYNESDKKLSEFANYAIDCHRSLNQKYDTHSYEYHLIKVDEVAKRFLYIYDKKPGINILYETIIRCGCFGHDLIEDAHQTYNNIFENIKSIEVAEIIRACTSDIRGRTRDERMTDEVYNDIRNTEFATFVKLCDRIANVEYSLLSVGKMFEKYKNEHTKFKSKLYTEELKPMFDHLDKIFNL